MSNNNPTRATNRQRKRIIKLYQAGESIARIGRSVGVPARSVRRLLTREGVHRPRGQRRIAGEVAALIISLHERGLTATEIARALNESDVRPVRASRWRDNVVDAFLRREGRLASTTDDAARFREKIRRTRDAHHLWSGAIHPDGHGVFSHRGSPTLAHRFAWEHAHGPLPRGAKLRNVCGARDCVNPDHWRIQGTFEEEFWSRTREDPATGCLVWLGRTNERGYGQTDVSGGYKSRSAHRVAYELTHRVTLEPTTHLHHLCRQASCVNPAHLLPVDAAGERGHNALHALEKELATALEQDAPHLALEAAAVRGGHPAQ